MRGLIGFIVMIQSAMAFIGQVFFDGVWGLLPRWFNLPSPAYVGLFAAGAALAVWGDTAKKRKQQQEGAGAA
ncbi:hypothetical protein QT196_18305 [Streptomyces sp. P9-2B-2]|uniref:hypothetical protein n=1 Tax=Streptomyces TaxID=1883 RepID=UPI0022524566|nr:MULTISPECIES: hypothetical protein [Streptomyces]MCX4639920.1 hypothetical protein [Streptomyces platensis]WJY39082.1 hypothetical protein QT196_18305 [Streptomyces sp. P9-2B-2]